MRKLLDFEANKYLVDRRFQEDSRLRNSNLFALYAKIFRALLAKWERTDGTAEDDGYNQVLEHLVLPSNEQWRLQVYYQLVELQRENDRTSGRYDIVNNVLDEIPLEMDRSTMMIDRNILEMLRLKKWDWEPDSRVVYPLTPRSSCKFDSVDSGSSPMLKNSVDPGWKLRDLLLAAKILTNSREKQEYADEAEMRRVFGLLYDVLRYKQILNSVLENVGFWQRYAQFRKRKQLVWLLLYDMHGRKFARVGNNSAVAMRNESLKQVNLLEVEKALLDMKTRVAAGLSRLRIKGSALTLEELLPDHQRVAEGVTWGEEGSIAFGWVNSSKVPTRGIFIEEMKKLGLMLCSGCSPTSELEEHEYVFDPLCPKVVNLHENAREKLASSELVRSHGFVFLERSLCLGAATLVHAFKVGKLSGPIILTHSLAPRHTGYLAELLVDLQDVGRLLVFGLGDKRTHCEAYLQKLGISMQRCKLFSERYTSETKLPEIERATVVLAAPPCSYTGVRDVVDLAIARDGDFRLLESLTSQQEKSPQQPRILLAEQMSTLKYALTRPNVQLVVYEVHTLLPCETADMTRQVVQQVNRMMLDKFQRDHAQRKKSSAKGSTGQISNSEYKSVSSESIVMSLDDSKLNIESEDEVSLDDTSELPKIPEGDLFEVSDLNDVYQRDCTKLVDRGAYVVLIKRKEIVQFNSQFMIEVAEGKGIFGDSTKQLMTLENYKVSTPAEAPQTGRKRRKSSKIQFERITAPTHASIVRALRDRHPCPRHQQHLVNEVSSVEKQVLEARRRDAHRWWDEVAHAWRSNSSNADDYRFHALRTDPLTRKILFPTHVMHITYAEEQKSSFAVS